DGRDNTFTPAELLLVALAGCSAIDVDQATSRHQSPRHFQVTASAVKQQDESGNKLSGIQVRFNLEFEDSVEGAAAQAILPRVVEISHAKLCTVARTIEAGEHVRMEVG
ncbi:MAG: OsmC family protein, partial [Propionibacteriaceae bacterium]|nr:OsmC family protein [Propionibacteriaceae bacterium]